MTNRRVKVFIGILMIMVLMLSCRIKELIDPMSFCDATDEITDTTVLEPTEYYSNGGPICKYNVTFSNNESDDVMLYLYHETRDAYNPSSAVIEWEEWPEIKQHGSSVFGGYYKNPQEKEYPGDSYDTILKIAAIYDVPQCANLRTNEKERMKYLKSSDHFRVPTTLYPCPNDRHLK